MPKNDGLLLFLYLADRRHDQTPSFPVIICVGAEAKSGDVRIAVEIEVAANLARSKDRNGERGGSRREQEWQEPRSRAKRRAATATAAARVGARSTVGHRDDLGGWRLSRMNWRR